ncbi:MAG TPA: response regulator [Aggregatilineales bacterium]|nr:response regulator [Aggregatilineales bacterium]
MSDKSVLVVDDETDIREMLRFMFTAAGFQVTTATNGEEALTSIRQQAPGAVLLDLMMPRKTGYDVIEILRSEGQLESLPVVILTARQIEPEDRARLNGTRAIFEKGSMDVLSVVHRFSAAIA